jgi:cell wall-associated NlpC family hydrolase
MKDVMVKQILPAVAFIFFLSSCTAIKSLNFTSNRQVSSVPDTKNSEVKFIDDISITPQIASDKTDVKPETQLAFTGNTRSIDIAQKQEADEISQLIASRNEKVEAVSSVELKYAVLMNTEVESLPTKALLENVDEWYGVRYRTGGNTKSGVDCSGFTVAVYSAVYGIALPRVSRDQYRISRKISTTELQEGDLVFFNTNGSGVSHVGVYLGHNKFIHASVSRGVMVNDLFEPYYLKRYYGAGRIDDKEFVRN